MYVRVIEILIVANGRLVGTTDRHTFWHFGIPLLKKGILEMLFNRLVLDVNPKSSAVAHGFSRKRSRLI
jgi:hypothetical protein